jgi:hypothetical protein
MFFYRGYLCTQIFSIFTYIPFHIFFFFNFHKLGSNCGFQYNLAFLFLLYLNFSNLLVILTAKNYLTGLTRVLPKFKLTGGP